MSCSIKWVRVCFSSRLLLFCELTCMLRLGCAVPYHGSVGDCSAAFHLKLAEQTARHLIWKVCKCGLQAEHYGDNDARHALLLYKYEAESKVTLFVTLQLRTAAKTIGDEALETRFQMASDSIRRGIVFANSLYVWDSDAHCVTHSFLVSSFCFERPERHVTAWRLHIVLEFCLELMCT